MLRPDVTWYERLILLLLIILVSWESILGAYKFSVFPLSAVDFFQHYFLGLHVNRGGSIEDVSWPQRIGELLGFHLPPSMRNTAPYLHYQLIVLPFFRVLALLRMDLAYAVWLVGNLLLIGYVAARIAPEVGTRRLTLLFILFLWPPIWHVLILGNVDSIVWVLMNLGWLSFMTHRERSGGFWMGLATLIKGFPAFAAIPWLVRKPGPALQGFGAGILIGVGWGTLWSGFEGWRFMIQHIPDYQRALAPFMPPNNSLLTALWALLGPPIQTERGLSYHGLLNAALPPSLLSSLHLGISLLLVVFTWRVIQRSPNLPTMGQSGAWLSMGLLIWPVSWINYHIYLFIPLAWLIAHRRSLRIATRLFAYGAIFPLTAALSYGFLASVTAPWMLMPLVMGATRLLLFWVFKRSLLEIREGTNRA